MASVEIINLVKRFNNIEVLKNINLKINEGELVTLLGKSGCGKSTILKLIAGLMNPDTGDILFDEKSVLKLKTQDRNAVIVFQDYSLFPHMNVFENIEFGLKINKVDKKVRKNKVLELINLVKLKGLENKYPSELSGGQQQRVAIARAISINPKILLLDEPFSSLDINLRNEMRKFILKIQKDLGITTILVTHDKEEALMMSDKIAVMINGEIVQVDTPKNLYEKPVSKEIANLLGERNFVFGDIKNGIFKSNFFDIDLNINENIDNIELMISKEDISIYDIKYQEGIEGTIENKIYAGDRTYYFININGKLLNVSSNKNFYKIGETIKIKIELRDIVYF